MYDTVYRYLPRIALAVVDELVYWTIVNKTNKTDLFLCLYSESLLTTPRLQYSPVGHHLLLRGTSSLLNR